MHLLNKPSFKDYRVHYPKLFTYNQNYINGIDTLLEVRDVAATQSITLKYQSGDFYKSYDKLRL